MFLRSVKPVFLCLIFAVGALFSIVIYAHSSLSLQANNVCKLIVGPYTMLFSGYQPDSSQEKGFCEDIPGTGRTMVTLDYKKKPLHPLPTEIRIIKDIVSEENLDAITILHIPASIYPNGSINFEYNFTEPGKYVGVVTVTGEKEYVSRFPFSVGGANTGISSSFLILIFVVVIGATSMFIYRKRQRFLNSELVLTS